MLERNFEVFNFKLFIGQIGLLNGNYETTAFVLSQLPIVRLMIFTKQPPKKNNPTDKGSS